MCQVVPKATHLPGVKPVVTNFCEAWCSSLQTGGHGSGVLVLLPGFHGMRPTGEGSAQCLAYIGFFFLGPSTACFPGVSPQGSETGQKKSSEAGAEHRAGLVVCSKGLWPGSTHWSGATSPVIAFVSWASRCPASADVASVHPQTIPGEETPAAHSKAPRDESEGPNQ